MNDNVDLLVGILEGCIQGCDMQIPYYAYGDNQAACEMVDRLNQIRNDLHNAIEIINSNARLHRTSEAGHNEKG